MTTRLAHALSRWEPALLSVLGAALVSACQVAPALSSRSRDIARKWVGVQGRSIAVEGGAFAGEYYTPGGQYHLEVADTPDLTLAANGALYWVDGDQVRSVSCLGGNKYRYRYTNIIESQDTAYLDAWVATDVSAYEILYRMTDSSDRAVFESLLLEDGIALTSAVVDGDWAGLRDSKPHMKFTFDPGARKVLVSTDYQKAKFKMRFRPFTVQNSYVYEPDGFEDYPDFALVVNRSCAFTRIASNALPNPLDPDAGVEVKGVLRLRHLPDAERRLMLLEVFQFLDGAWKPVYQSTIVSSGDSPSSKEAALPVVPKGFTLDAGKPKSNGG